MWRVGFTGKAAKQYNSLSDEIKLLISALVAELAVRGPMVPEWRNFGKLGLKVIDSTAI